MPQQELLIEVAAALDAHGIAYMVIGSIASSLFGEPRLTHDIDVIVRVAPQDALTLTGSFPPRYHLLIDTHTGTRSISGSSRAARSTSRDLLGAGA